MHDIIRFHVPCDKKYQKMVEEFATILAEQMQLSTPDDFSDDLKQVMSDVFNNIVNYSNTAAQNEVVRFQFEVDHPFFLISIYDYGPGFKADQFQPPYPKEFIGQSYKLCEADKGAVQFNVVDPVTISFTLSQSGDKPVGKMSDLTFSRERCENLARITRMMDSVSYSYIGHGKYDWKLTRHLK
jgi:anti-sigma regulatory factor (Ser/Thr protein kinase)